MISNGATNELDARLCRLQKSTRTSIKWFIPFHNFLRMKYRWYYNWHLNPSANYLHLQVLLIYLLFLVFGWGITQYFVSFVLLSFLYRFMQLWLAEDSLTGDLNDKMRIIQLSTRTTFPQFEKIHNFLRMYSKSYYFWHLKSYAKKVHWTILILYILLVVAGIRYILVNSNRQIAKATYQYVFLGSYGGEGLWSNPDNWEGARIPGPDDDVIISMDNSNILTIDTAATAASFTVEGGYYNNIIFTDGASLTLTKSGGGSGNLTINGDGSPYFGTTANNSIIVPGDLTMTYGMTFNPEGSTFTIGGSNINLGDTFTFNNMVIDSPAVNVSDYGIYTAGNLTINAGKTLNATGKDITVIGTFANDGTLVRSGDEAGSSFTNDTDSGTIEYAATSSTRAIQNWTYYGLKINGSGGTFTQPAALTVNGPFSLSAGTYTQGGYDLTVKKDFTIASGAIFTKATGGTKLKLLGDLTYTDSNTTKQNLGILEIGASPDTTTLATDLVADSLTIGAGDILNTKGYDLDIGGNIVLNTGSPGGKIDTTDNGGAGYEGNGSNINVAGNFTINSGGVFTKCVQASRRSKIIMDGGATKTLTSAANDLGDFQISTASTLINLLDHLTVQNLTIDASTTLVSRPVTTSYNITAANVTIQGTLNAASATSIITVSGNWDSSAGTFTYGTSTINLTGAAPTLTTGDPYTTSKQLYNIQMTTSNQTVTLGSQVGIIGTCTIGSTSGNKVTVNGNALIMFNATSPLVFNGTYNTNPGYVLSSSASFRPSSDSIIPAGTYNGLNLSGTADLTATAQGNITANSLVIGSASWHKTATWDTAGYTSTVNISLSMGNGTTGYAKLITHNSTISITSNLTVNNSDVAGKNIIDATGTPSISVGGNWNLTNGSGTYTGIFTSGSSTVNFDAPNNRTFAVAGQAFYHLNFSGAGTKTISGNLDVNGNLTVATGSLDLATNDPTVTLAGNVSISASTTWTKQDNGTSTTTFDGTTNYTDANATKQDLGLVIVNGTFVTITSGGMKTSNFTLTAGTFDVNDFSMNITGNTIFTSGTYKTGAGSNTFGDAGGDSVTVNGGTIEIESDATADITKNAGTWTNTAGTISYKAGSAVSNGTVIGLTPYYNLEVNSTGSTYSLLESTVINNNFTITSGTVYAETINITVSGTFSNNGTLQLLLDGNQTISLTNDDNSGTVEYLYYDSGTSILDWTYFNLKINGGGYYYAPMNEVTVNGNFDVADGTYDLSNGGSAVNLTVVGDINIGGNGTVVTNDSSITVAGNWTNAGTFTSAGGVVTFNGTAGQSITGETSFSYLVMDTTIADSANQVTFEAGSTQTITGAWTLNGADTKVLTLVSSTPDTAWYFDIPANMDSGDYINVQDSQTATAYRITPGANVTNSGNNDPGWVFNQAPNSPASLLQKKVTGGATLATGDWTNETQVEFTAMASDPGVSDTLYLCVEKDFIATALGSANGGDLCGTGVAYSGTPVAVSVTITGLSDASQYHWQAQIKDAATTYSSFVGYGGNTENPPTNPATRDFGIDTSAPTSGTVNDGTGADQDWNDGSLTSLSANWNSFDSSASGLQKYEFAIRRLSDGYYWNTAGGGAWQSGEVWYDNGTSTTATVSSLNLKTSAFYFFSVKATDNAGNTATAVNSNGQQVLPTLSFALSSNNISFTNLSGSNDWTDTDYIDLTTSTNASAGYSIFASMLSPLTSPNYSSESIQSYAGTWETPTTWNSGVYGFGYTSSDTLVGGSNRFASGTKYTGFPSPPNSNVVADNTNTINGSTGAVVDEIFRIFYKVAVSTIQTATTYTGSITYTVTANY